MKRIAIIGHGTDIMATALVDKLQKEHDAVIINSINEVKPDLLSNQESYAITYQKIPEIAAYGQSKPFICKGRHEYREVKETIEMGNGTIVKSTWICQCGRKL